MRNVISDTADRLKDYCLERVGDDLRSVVGYTDGGIESTYFRDDVTLTVEEWSIDALHNPVLAFHRSGWRLTEMFEHFSPPTASLQAYEEKLLFTFPITRTDGIYVSVEREDAYIVDLFPELETIVDESEDGER